MTPKSIPIGKKGQMSIIALHNYWREITIIARAEELWSLSHHPERIKNFGKKIIKMEIMSMHDLRSGEGVIILKMTLNKEIKDPSHLLRVLRKKITETAEKINAEVARRAHFEDVRCE